MKTKASIEIEFNNETTAKNFAKSLEPENKEVSEFIQIKQKTQNKGLKIEVSTNNLSSFSLAVDDILEKVGLIWELMKNMQNEKD